MITRDGDRVMVGGALTIENAVAMREAGKRELTDDVVFDLSGVTEVDSAALSLIFEWQREAQQNSHRIQFCNLPESMQSLAKLYGVDELIPTGA